jgi:2,4-dienoyl-CoA reductase (NADPH2)
MTAREIGETVQCFAEGARRAKDAGLDGVELHGSNGYLITQFLSSGINDRDDEYGGSLENRTRFVLEVVRAIRKKVGRDFHLQMKINGVDHNNWLYPWLKPGNTLADTLEICEILRDNGEGVDAFHVSSGSTFPHPRNPPGDFPLLAARRWYDGMLSQGVRTVSQYLVSVAGSGVAFRLLICRRGPSSRDQRRLKRAIKKHFKDKGDEIRPLHWKFARFGDRPAH